MAGLSFAFDANAGETPQSIAQKRALIAQLMGSQSSPKTIGEGFGAIGDGIVANVLGSRAKEAETAGQGSANDTYSQIMASLTGQGSTPSAASSAAGGGSNAYRDAIASIESAGRGDYNAVGPTNPSLGRALGRYQVMEANIGPWSKAALGREISPDEFLANPQLQDQIFDHQFGSYVDQFGPQGAAQAWFAGPGGVGKGDRRDALGTSVSAYTDKFTNALGGPQSTQVASLDPSMGAPQQQLPPIAPAGGPQMASQPPQAAQGPSLQMLMEAAANPWLNESQKAIINSMISQQMTQQQQASDPLRQQQLQLGQLGIEKSQLELGAMRNPQPTPGFRQLSPQEAQQSNLDPAKAYQVGPDGKIYEIGGGGTNVTVNNSDGAPGLGKLSTDFGYVLDPATGQPKIDLATGLPTAAAVPGSPAAIAAQQAAAQADSKGTTTSRYGNVVVEDIDRALDTLAKDPTWTTGILGQAMGNFKGSSADRLNNLLDTVKSNAGFDRLQAMRDASPTGGALGAVSENENKLLQSAIGSLETSNPEDLAYNLKRVQRIYDEIINGPKTAQPGQSQANPDVVDFSDYFK